MQCWIKITEELESEREREHTLNKILFNNNLLFFFSHFLGHSKVPIELCALAYIIGIQQFGTGRALREVHFIDKDIAVVNEVKTAFNKYKENPISITLETMKSMYPKYFGMKGEDTRNRKSTSNGNPQVSKQRLCLSNAFIKNI